MKLSGSFSILLQNDDVKQMTQNPAWKPHDWFWVWLCVQGGQLWLQQPLKGQLTHLVCGYGRQVEFGKRSRNTAADFHAGVVCFHFSCDCKPAHYSVRQRPALAANAFHVPLIPPATAFNTSWSHQHVDKAVRCGARRPAANTAEKQPSHLQEPQDATVRKKRKILPFIITDRGLNIQKVPFMFGIKLYNEIQSKNQQSNVDQCLSDLMLVT